MQKTSLFPEEIACDMSEFKTVLASSILTFILLGGGMELESADLAFGQFFENSETNGDITNSSNLASNSTSSENANVGEIVLLSQKLKKPSYDYRDLVGQVKNIGNDTAESVRLLLTVYDKNGGVIGTETVYADVDTLKPEQKSTFKFFPLHG